MPEHASHFDSPETQAHASRLGMWVFLASEVLLFGALFTLYSASRVEHPQLFRDGVHQTDRVLGTVNTLVLLTSSFFVASAVHFRERRARAFGLVVATIALGAVFLVLKLVEWSKHIHDGLVPGRGIFFTLYYLMTGLHALHVVIGVCALGFAALRPKFLENIALYWHLVDVVWIFLWPLFYLTGG